MSANSVLGDQRAVVGAVLVDVGSVAVAGLADQGVVGEAVLSDLGQMVVATVATAQAFAANLNIFVTPWMF